jgi:uncharacterized membrane protein YgcG
MNGQVSRFCLVALLAFGLLLAASPQALAQADLPDTDGKCINDHAGVVGKSDKSKIKSLCKKAVKNKIEMMVVTIDSLDDYPPRPLSVDRFADTIFEEWDTGYEESGDAVMLFISVKENEFRVLLGDRYPDKLRKRAVNIIRKKLVPNFRRRRRSQGIRSTYSSLYYDIVKPHIRALKKEELRRRQKQGVVDFDQ